MARINIDDKLFQDDRFQNFVVTIGNPSTALGALVKAFIMAQHHWSPNERPIPADKFRSLPYASDMLRCDLAYEVENGAFIYVRGSKEQFSWLIQRSQAGRKNKGKSRKRKITGPNGCDPLTLTLTPTLTHTPVLDLKNNAPNEKSSVQINAPLADALGNYGADVSLKLQNLWIETYSDTEWIKSEIKKAISWILVNPTRSPKKNFSRFFNSWIQRGWEFHRKTLPSNKVISKIDLSKLED